MSYKIFSLSFQEETLKKIDSVRGLIARSAYMEEVLSNHLKKLRTGKN